MTVSRAPLSLVVHLKRFSYGNGFGKINKKIEFSEVLYLDCNNDSISMDHQGTVGNNSNLASSNDHHLNNTGKQSGNYQYINIYFYHKLKISYKYFSSLSVDWRHSTPWFLRSFGSLCSLHQGNMNMIIMTYMYFKMNYVSVGS